MKLNLSFFLACFLAAAPAAVSSHEEQGCQYASRAYSEGAAIEVGGAIWSCVKVHSAGVVFDEGSTGHYVWMTLAAARRR
jgi:hypothetical protein